MRIPARLMKPTLLLTAALVGMGLFGSPAWSQESDSEDQTQLDEEAADQGTADEETSDEVQGADEDQPEAEAESVDDPAADETDETRDTEEAASGEEEESTDDAESEDAEQTSGETEPAQATAPEPTPGQSSVVVESWAITLKSAMGDRSSELTMQKPEGGAVVATISHTDGGASRAPVQVTGNNLAWAWEVTNPMPMQITCEATIQGEQLAGMCTVGAFGKAPVHGSRK